MNADAVLFWILAIVTVTAALSVVLLANPIFSSLSLVMTMIGVSALFVTLGAYFIAGVQLIVYAGAVMVLFVMVIMLFDLKHENETFSSGQISGAVKIASIGMLAGLIVGAILMSIQPTGALNIVQTADNTKNLSMILFTKYLFSFEALGVLLLVVAIGAVTLSRSKGGTHAKQ